MIARTTPRDHAYSMERLEQFRLESYFEATIGPLYHPHPEASAVVVAHMLRDAPCFLRALSKIVRVRAVLPKPKSIDDRSLATVEGEFDVVRSNREQIGDSVWLRNLIDDGSKSTVLIDIGGYFAPALQDPGIQRCVLGVVEDTENGLQKYQRLHPQPSLPVLQVARSPLKEAEDHMVGHSIVFSTEALMRSRGDMLCGRSACVIGYGKVGRSIARLLQTRGVATSVFDIDPIRLTEAVAHGMRVTGGLREALSGAGLVVCATGNLSLKPTDFRNVASGAYVAAVTSSDDELGLDGLGSHYDLMEVENDVVRYKTDGHYFFVLNKGNAVNFLHGSGVGPAIHLVQAEILADVMALLQGTHEPGYGELDHEARRRIAAFWLEHFEQTERRPNPWR